MSVVLEKKKLNQETRKLIGADAGPSNNAHELASLGRISERRKDAESFYGRAIYALVLRKRREASELIEEALRAISEAFWIAEDTELEDSQHDLLHKIAKWKYDNLGCCLVKSGNDYEQRCAIALTHKRLGFSMGFTSNSVCTICGKDEFECVHSRDRSYWVVGGLNQDGRCNVCDQEDCVEHDGSFIYRVCPAVRLMNPVLHEISMVRKPAIPMARLTSIPVPRKDIEAEVGIIDESIGMVYKCHVCGGPCPGFTEFKRP